MQTMFVLTVFLECPFTKLFNQEYACTCTCKFYMYMNDIRGGRIKKSVRGGKLGQ